jgi:signal transduction histidine kinase
VFSFFSKKYTKTDTEDWKESLKVLTNTVNSIRYGNLKSKIDYIPHKEFKNITESINRMIDTLNDRERMIIEYQTEQKRQNDFLEKIINCLLEGIIVVDEDKKILQISQKISVWFGEKEVNIINKKLNDYINIKNDFKTLEEDEVTIKNSAFVFVATTTELISAGKKNYVLTIRNITNQLELEKIKEDFVATLTHDLKVPIIAESNMLDLLIAGKFGKLNENQIKVLNGMKSSNQELLELVQTLLLSYKIENSEMYFDFVEIDLYNLINELLNDIEVSSEHKVNLLSKTHTKIYGDSLHIKRVLKNLISNAILHGNSLKPVNIKYLKRNGIVKIMVTDYGKGIPKEDMPFIFDKFFSTSKKFRKAGTGLGLYLSKQIIEAHGGKISVKSEEGIETEFCIELPADKR